MDTVKIASFNILAPCWANPKYYCLSGRESPLLFPSEDRIARTLQYIDKNIPNADIFCFEEVDSTVLPQLRAHCEALGFFFFTAFHDLAYWADWTHAFSPLVPNGNSIAINKNKFEVIKTVDLSLGSTGNHGAAVIARIISLKSTSRVFRIVAVHFELDSLESRTAEIKSVMKFLKETDGEYPEAIDVIAGDYNTELDTPEARRSFPFLLDRGVAFYLIL